MTDKMRTAIARELLDIIILRQTPDCIELDCDLKSRISCPARPWPFASVDDAATHFKRVTQASKKYSDVRITTDRQVLRLTLKRK